MIKIIKTKNRTISIWFMTKMVYHTRKVGVSFERSKNMDSKKDGYNYYFSLNLWGRVCYLSVTYTRPTLREYQKEMNSRP